MRSKKHFSHMVALAVLAVVMGCTQAIPQNTHRAATAAAIPPASPGDAVTSDTFISGERSLLVAGEAMSFDRIWDRLPDLISDEDAAKMLVSIDPATVTPVADTYGLQFIGLRSQFLSGFGNPFLDTFSGFRYLPFGDYMFPYRRVLGGYSPYYDALDVGAFNHFFRFGGLYGFRQAALTGLFGSGGFLGGLGYGGALGGLGYGGVLGHSAIGGGTTVLGQTPILGQTPMLDGTQMQGGTQLVEGNQSLGAVPFFHRSRNRHRPVTVICKCRFPGGGRGPVAPPMMPPVAPPEATPPEAPPAAPPEAPPTEAPPAAPPEAAPPVATPPEASPMPAPEASLGTLSGDTAATDKAP